MQNSPTNVITFVAEVSGDMEHLMDQPNEGHFPFLPIRDNVLIPGAVMPIRVTREMSVRTLQYAEKNNLLVAVFMQKKRDIDVPTLQDMESYGVVAKLVHAAQTDDEGYTGLFQALNRVKLQDLQETPNGWECDVVASIERKPQPKEWLEYCTTLSLIKERILEFASLTDEFPNEAERYIRELGEAPYLVNYVLSILPISHITKYKLMRKPTIMERATQTLLHVNNLVELAKLKHYVEQKTQSDIDKQQREYFLNQEIRNLQAELGQKDDNGVKEEDISQLRDQASKKNWPQSVAEAFDRELAKLGRINVQMPDYNVQLNYLQTLVELPWRDYTTDNIDIKKAGRRLDKDHYGLERVKERILEHLAVLKLRNDNKSPIICLYGPPGVGKTSLGRSIAEALGRKYVRVSLGGLHDESEIRGHRRTYVGAMPGRIIAGIQKAGSANPVFILDEIDKVSTANHNGDPSSALLEVLDPEQNSAFHDNYLDIDYDLSQVMFIATANDISGIPTPLLDRMELIEVNGYLTEEKIEIAKHHLVPKKREENGLGMHKRLKLNKETIEFIAERYTRESGVRALEKLIDKIFRRVALKVVADEMPVDKPITQPEVERFLGKPRFSRDQYQGNEFAGVVTGLAWTSVGGEILFIETSVSRGKSAQLTMTGNLGDVMKESAMLACEYIRAHAQKWNIDPRVFDHYNLHIHVPEGAVPKDGPSAGVTMATSIVSALTQRKVRRNIAMTGEITLRGKVLPVGGIKEKILAAKRAGITHLILCHENRKDIEEIPETYLRGLDFHYVHTISDVLDYALLTEKVKEPVQFIIPEEKDEKKQS